jgi:hypothetical protein
MTTTLENQILDQLKKEAFDSYETEQLKRTIVEIRLISQGAVFFKLFEKSEIDGSINEYNELVCDISSKTGKFIKKSIRVYSQSSSN